MSKTKRDWLSWAAMFSALAVTASAEWSLAVACGFSPWIAAGVPASLDIYTLRAMSTGQDVPYAVIAMIVVQALAHLVAAGVLTVSWPLIVLVAAIAPLVLWRVHKLGTHSGTHPNSANSVEVSTGVSSVVDRASAVSTPVNGPVRPLPATPDSESEPTPYAPLRAVPEPLEADYSATPPETQSDTQPDSEEVSTAVSSVSADVSSKLGDSEAREVIEQSFREGLSTRKAAELATRSQTHVAKVFRELRAA